MLSIRNTLCVSGVVVLAYCSRVVLSAPTDLDTQIKRQAGGACAPLELFHAAGTGESGLGIVGNAWARALPAAVSGATVTAINYNTAAEYFATVRTGAATAVSVITARAAACPNTKFVLSGYSKGAMVVHATKLSANVQSKMVAVVVFGDPNKKFGSLAVPLNNAQCFISFCNTGDQFCDTVGTLGPHLAYPRDGSVTRGAAQVKTCFDGR